MPLKLMLDTNCFDFIFNQGLLQKMVTARAKGKAEFYFTTVQRDEIEAFKDKDPAKLIPAYSWWLLMAVHHNGKVFVYY
jgi:hypothetical protein